MSERSDDRWAAGDAYEAYMGRWSRALARVFLGWLGPAPSGHWLEVGCGTGALTTAIAALGRPASVTACDPSAPFIEHARRELSDVAAFHVTPSADALPRRDGGFDAIVCGLVLNFVPEPARALAAMRERCRAGGTVAAYVWDYGGGVEFLRHFWEEAVAADPGAAALDESQRFGSWTTQALASLFHGAGLAEVEVGVLEMETTFSSFEDYWRPFLGGSGPAPSYVAALAPEHRDSLRARLERRLPSADDGTIRLRARALAVRSVAPPS
jgi:SAM-dependent methyltransferase